MLLRDGRSAVLSGDAAPSHAIVAYACDCIRVYGAQIDEATQEPEHHDNVSHMMSPTRPTAATLTESTRACRARRSGINALVGRPIGYITRPSATNPTPIRPSTASTEATRFD